MEPRRTGKTKSVFYNMRERLNLGEEVFFWSSEMSKEQVVENFKEICKIDVTVEEGKNDIMKITIKNG